MTNKDPFIEEAIAQSEKSLELSTNLIKVVRSFLNSEANTEELSNAALQRNAKEFIDAQMKESDLKKDNES